MQMTIRPTKPLSWLRPLHPALLPLPQTPRGILGSPLTSIASDENSYSTLTGPSSLPPSLLSLTYSIVSSKRGAFLSVLAQCWVVE